MALVTRDRPPHGCRMQASTGSGLRRDILRIGVVLLVVNGMIGSGIFKLPAKVASDAGAASLWLIPVVGLLFLAIVFCFAELASRFDQSGGPVQYCGTAFGPGLGFQAGWLLFLSRMTALAANAGVLMEYLGREVEYCRTPLGRGLGLSMVLASVGLINICGIRGAMRTLIGISLLKLLPLLALVVWGLVSFDPGILQAQPSAETPDLERATIVVVYAFVGFETVTVTAGETRNAARNIPRALIWTLCGIILLYFGVQVAYLNVAGTLSDDPDAPLLAVGEAWLGTAGYYLLFIAAVTSLLGNLHTSTVAAPRLVFALAEARELPAFFARIHRRFATPWTCIALYSLGGIALGLWGGFTDLASASSLSRTLVYGLCALALLALRRLGGRAPFHLRGGALLPILAVLICAWLSSLVAARLWGLLGLLVGIGMVLQALGRRGARLSAGSRSNGPGSPPGS